MIAGTEGGAVIGAFVVFCETGTEGSDSRGPCEIHCRISSRDE
jgi:hypothetical protein